LAAWTERKPQWLIAGQYFPKQSPLDTVTQHKVDMAINEMNHRQRKPLNDKTSWEILFEKFGQYLDSFSSVTLMT
jgi:IS30 family transposase